MLDTRTSHETPEGIDLSLTAAGPVARGYAWCLDFLIRLGAYLGLMLVLGGLGNFGLGLGMIAYFLLEWFYPVIFEALNHGATPGKKALGLKVVHDDGSPVSWGASLVRNLLRAVDFLPLLNGVGLISCACRADFKRLGDIAAGTLVVYAERAEVPIRLGEGPAQAPPQSLRLDEQQAVLAFAERAATLSPERQAELARILVPELLDGDADPVAALFRHARWLTGPGR